MTQTFVDTAPQHAVFEGPRSQSNHSLSRTAQKLLTLSARFWFLVAVVGQLIFAGYIIAFYGGSALSGNLDAWAEVLPHGIVAGETMANTALAAHLFVAAIITIGGPLQLIPQIRARFPKVHHWNGRVYITTAFLASLSGLYIIWTRGTVGGIEGHISISINAVLIMFFAVMALRHAIARNIPTHQRWALRLFLVVSGVWFFRVGLMLWLTIHQAPVGFDPDSFRGPFLTFMNFAQYLLPLAVLELYLRARDGRAASAKLAMSGVLTVLALAMGVGIFAATFGMWLPRL